MRLNGWRIGLIVELAVIWAVSAAWAQAPIDDPLARKAPLPPEAVVNQEKAQWRDTYATQLAQAKTARAKASFVTTLLASARLQGEAPARKFALQAFAHDVAISAGDWEGGLKAVAETAKDYEVDPFDLADELRSKLDLINSPPLEPKKAFLFTVEMVHAASSKDRYDVAERFALSAQKIARKGGDTTSANQVAAHLPDLQRLGRQFDAVKASLQTLDKSPLDPAANLAVGKFRCYAQARWEEGLTMLALGSDAELARLAEIELRMEGRAPELVKLADDWWNLPATMKEEAGALRRHAVDCYLRARDRVQGAEQMRIEKRLAEVEKWHSKDATYIISPAISASSSPFDKAHLPMPALLNTVDKFYKERNGAEFAFHITDPNAYIVIDLKREEAISRLQILNSIGGQTPERTRGMMVFVSKSLHSRGEQVWQAPDAADEWNVYLPKLHYGRYITMALNPATNGGHFHLRKVKVFGPE